jgi:hypothetical protein
MLWAAETHLRLLNIDCQPYKMKFSLQQDQCQRYTLSKNLCSKYHAMVILRWDLHFYKQNCQGRAILSLTPASKLAVSCTEKFYIEKK